MIKAVLFDLDGTLADTAPDLIGALNGLLEEEGREPLPPEQLRPYVSGGTRALVGQGFGLTPDHPGYARLADRFLAIYADTVCMASVLFPGIESLLSDLEIRGIPWGIVTNKGTRFTTPLVAGLGLSQRAACVISGDTAARPKPHPDPLLLACRSMAIEPSACVYLGDDLRDIQAGQAAGMATVVAAYGYLGDGPHYTEWQGDAIINDPAELLPLLPILGESKRAPQK